MSEMSEAMHTYFNLPLSHCQCDRCPSAELARESWFLAQAPVARKNFSVNKSRVVFNVRSRAVKRFYST